MTGREQAVAAHDNEETAVEILRLSFAVEDEASASAAAIAEAGHEVAVVKERFAGEDDDEEVVFVVATPAPLDRVEKLLCGDYFVE